MLQDVRPDDCRDLMIHFCLRLVRDAVGDADPEEVQAARQFILHGTLTDKENVSEFTFDQALTFINIEPDIVRPVFDDLELIGWRKNSMIFRLLLQTLNQK